MWESLAPPWQCCLEEAWTAYCSGSLPIGAVVADGTGRIIARGRNRIFEETAEGRLLCGHRLAHAEMNALIALEWRQVDPATAVLYTTTEPCPLCTGAIRMIPIGEVHYASRDPGAGSIALLDATPFMRRRAIKVIGPQRADLEVIVMAMHVECALHRGLAGYSSQLFDTWGAVVPRGVELGQALLRSGQLGQMREEGTAVAAVVNQLAEIGGLSEHPAQPAASPTTHPPRP